MRFESLIQRRKPVNRSSRYDLYFRGSCWPASFGLLTSEPRLCSFHSCSSTMQCPARLSVTPQGARFLKRGQICLPEALISTGLFLIFCTAVEREFRNCTFQNKSDTIFLSTLVDMLGFARPCISSRQQQTGQPGHNLGTKFKFKKGELSPFWPHYQ